MIGNGSSVERYELLGELATGGMATVYMGRQHGALGFARTVAIKSMHPQLTKDPTFRAMFVDEAHLTAKIRHPNVVPTLDIVSSATKLLLVMEYIEGVSLSVLVRAARTAKRHIPVPVVVSVVRDMLEGLHAAHELRNDAGEPLAVVHRDVSPQNVLVGVDGIARMVDFGVAKATGRNYHTQTGEIRGKVGYMAPEQMFGEEIDRRVDIYASGVVLWEALATDRLFHAPTDAALVLLVLKGMASTPSEARGEPLPEALNQLVARALSHDQSVRFATAAEMLRELVSIVPPASREEVGRVVQDLAGEELALRTGYLKQAATIGELGQLEPEARAVLDILTRATMTRDNLSSSMAPGKDPRRLVLSVSAGLVVLSLILSGLVVTFTKQGGFSRAGAAGTMQAPPPPAQSTVAPPPEERDTSAAGSSSGPLPASSELQGGRIKAGRRATTKGPASAPTAPPLSSSGKPDCTLPYVTDEEGRRHYKAECLR